MSLCAGLGFHVPPNPARHFSELQIWHSAGTIRPLLFSSPARSRTNTMAAKYKQKLKNALERFDVANAENLVVDLAAAEEAGYECTIQERRLWDRLLKCIEQFRRTLTSLE
jgi:hypothetical protein